MKRKGAWKETLKFVVPILLLVIGIGFVFAWEFYIKETINSQKVVVASNDISFKEQITRDDLTIASINIDNIVNGSFRPDEIDYIIEEFASINIKKGTQIYADLIDNYNLIPDEAKGEFIAPLPNDWIYAVAGSLRRAYLADFYVVGTDEQILLESLIQDSRDYGNQNVEVDEETEESIEQEESDESNEQENNETDSEESDELNEEEIERTESIVKGMYEPILKDVRISSVLDSGNRQVKESVESPDSATGNISELEIISTSEMLQTIQEYVNKGYKLYIVHKFEMSGSNSEELDESEEVTEDEEE